MRIYSGLSAGDHDIYVKDDNGCITSNTITVTEDQFPGIIAIFPEANAKYIDVSNITFDWLAGTYTDNQQYDLYLKEESGSYILIASNLNSDEFVYNNDLTYNTKYFWKVVVKNSSGAEESFKEFAFTTITDPALLLVPTLINPVNGYTQYTDIISLVWSNQSGDFIYDVFLDENNPPTTMIANNIESSTLSVSNLSKNKSYYWKVKIKKTGTDLSEESDVSSFIIKDSSAPSINSFSVDNLLNVATLNANINSNGLETTVSFEYGKTTAYGSTVSANPNTITGGLPVDVSKTISNIDPRFAYHFRVVATNSLGTTYSEDKVISAMGLNYIYGGGRVVYVFNEGDPKYVEGEAHGFAMSQNLGNYVWTFEVDAAVGTLQDFGTGASNTAILIAAYGDSNYAAKVCGDYSYDGFTDWFLPSIGELVRISDYYGTFSTAASWSSSEADLDEAYIMLTSNTTSSSVISTTHAVYAIREF